MFSLNFLWGFMLHNFTVKYILGNASNISDSPDTVYMYLVLKDLIAKGKLRLFMLTRGLFGGRLCNSQFNQL